MTHLFIRFFGSSLLVIPRAASHVVAARRGRCK
jgi:hypothetical protein